MAEAKLKKSIGFGAALSTVAGTVIGTGVFFKASAVTESTGTVSLSMLAWLIGGLITICAGLTAAELAAMYPETGGLTKYIEYSYGPFWGFLAGWAQAVVYFPANIAAISIAFGTQFVNLFGLKAIYIIPAAIICVITIMTINFISVKVAGKVTTIALICKLIPLVAIVVLGFFHSGSEAFSLFPVTAGSGSPFFTALGQALLATMFAYDGWIHVGNMAGEMKNPKRDLPLAIAIGIAIVMVVYLLVNGVFYWIKPISEISGNLNIASDVSNVIFGEIGGKIITIGILISVYGGLNGYIMTGMRVPYVMGLKNKLPFGKYLSKLNKSGVPYISGIVQFVIAFFMILSGKFDAITNMLIFVIWLFYTMAFWAVIKLRRQQPDLQRSYKVPLYPLIPIIAIIGGLFILISTVITQFGITMIGLLITILGIPFYVYLNKKYDLN
ncbi:APC family permease [Lactobacillus terrae]|uniref:APC family permease n=1 Tax=Lactobacillus terrae TaxID=2269374 RepID=UPI000C1B7211|nr:amino acid permease [Lactobacillus terrae]